MGDRAMLGPRQAPPPQRATGALLPMNNLPQWSRVNNLDRARYPKPFTRDDATTSSGGLTAREELATGVIVGDVGTEKEPIGTESSTVDFQKKVQVLESMLSLLKQQHGDVLRSLHDEVDFLKRQTQDLQFKLVMFQSLNKNVEESDEKPNAEKNFTFAKNQLARRTPENEELEVQSGDILATANENEANYSTATDQRGKSRKVVKVEAALLLKEVAQLKNLLEMEKCQSAQLREELGNVCPSQARTVDSKGGLLPMLIPHPPLTPRLPEYNQRARICPTIASVSPMQVDRHRLRAPAINECEVMIKHLAEENQLQSSELKKMKTDLREVLYTHKWTPDSFLLARSYLPMDGSYEAVTELTESQRQSLRGTRKLQRLVSLPKDELFLPPLNQSISYYRMERESRGES